MKFGRNMEGVISSEFNKIEAQVIKITEPIAKVTKMY